MAIDLTQKVSDILAGLDTRMAAAEAGSRWYDESTAIDIDEAGNRAWVAGTGEVALSTLIANHPVSTARRGAKFVGNPSPKPTAIGALDAALRAGTGTIMVETQTAAADSVANARIIGGTGFHGIINMVDMDRATSFNGSNSTPPAIAGAGTFLGPSRTAVRWGAGNSRRAICMNGGNIATASTGTAPPAAIYIGVPGTYQTDTQSLQGYSRRIKVWPAEATDAEMVSRTTVTFPAGPANLSVPKIIVDTDLAQDVDDMGALAVLIAAHKRGECQIIGVITTTPFVYSAPCARATLDTLGLTAVPVGAYMGNVGYNGSAYAQQIAAEFGQSGKTRADFPDAVTLMRQLLASNSNVVINTIGGFQSVAALLQSPGDGVSSLTGMQLVTAKVDRLVMMGGIMSVTEGAPQFYNTEFNFQEAPSTTAYVLANWPTKRIISDWRMGNVVNTIPPSSESATTNPFKRAYDLFAPPASGRGSWDPIATLFAIYGTTGGMMAYAHSGGTLTYNQSGGTMSYDPEAVGLDTFIWRAPAYSIAQMKARIEADMVVVPPTPPAFSKPTDANVQPPAWADVPDSASRTMNGSAVASIANKGTAGGSFAQATAANQPGLSTLGGLAALLFDSGTKYLDLPLANNGGYLDAWFTVSLDAAVANDARIAVLTSSQAEDFNGVGGFGLTLNASSLTAFRDAGNGGNASIGYTGRDVLLVVRVQAGTTTPLTITINNGTPVVSARTITQNFASLVLRLGAGKTSSGANNPLRGKLRDAVTFFAPINAASVTGMWSYMARTAQ